MIAPTQNLKKAKTGINFVNDSLMKPYKNLSGSSGIVAYEIGKNLIKIIFSSHVRPYVYTYKRPGKIKVEQMKELAKKGKGLATYINKFVRDNFDYQE
jgi:hypothetical protein